MDFFDILLAKKLEDDRDPKVEGLSVTENGRYHEDGVVYDPVIVNVPETPLSKLTVTENGTYTAPTGTGYDEVTVDVPLPSNAYLLKEIEDVEIASFNDGSDLSMPKLEVAIEPVQDLHGYDSPWVGGAGKNKLPMTVEGIKAVNTYHSWSGNSTTINNVTITIETDENNNVTGIKFNGTASADITFNLASNITISNGSYIWSNDQIVNISNLWLSLTSPNIAITLSTQKEVNVTVSSDSIGSAYIYASSGNVFNNIVFKPMIRLASVSDSTFAPYSNICPISGWTDCEVTVADDLENPTVSNVYTIDLDGTRYGGTLDVVSGVLTVDRAMVDLGTLNWSCTSSSWRSLFTSDDITDYKHTGARDIPVNAISECFEIVSMSTIFKNGQMGMDGVEERNRTIICDNRYTDATSFKTAMDGVQLVYELATPLTIQLTPTMVKSLKGKNNVFADSGNILDLSYLAKEE